MTISEVAPASLADHQKRKAGQSIERLQLRSMAQIRWEGRRAKGLPNRPAGLSKAPTAGSGDDKTLAENIDTWSAVFAFATWKTFRRRG